MVLFQNNIIPKRVYSEIHQGCTFLATVRHQSLPGSYKMCDCVPTGADATGARLLPLTTYCPESPEVTAIPRPRMAGNWQATRSGPSDVLTYIIMSPRNKANVISCNCSNVLVRCNSGEGSCNYELFLQHWSRTFKTSEPFRTSFCPSCNIGKTSFDYRVCRHRCISDCRIMSVTGIPCLIV